MGPFELMDLIGNDVNYTVTETVWKQMFFDSRYKPSLTQKRLFESGRFGRKTGRGYYSYLDGDVMPEPVRNRELSGQIFSRVLTMLINEAVDAFYLKVATREDIDLAMTKGVNYPKGLLRWCDELGAEKILNNLMSLRIDYAEERYRPSVLLHKMAKENLRFYS
jgi:3-hydroxybutyryl-CoA dehydrogenase